MQVTVAAQSRQPDSLTARYWEWDSFVAQSRSVSDLQCRCIVVQRELVSSCSRKTEVLSDSMAVEAFNPALFQNTDVAGIVRRSSRKSDIRSSLIEGGNTSSKDSRFGPELVIVVKGVPLDLKDVGILDGGHAFAVQNVLSCSARTRCFGPRTTSFNKVGAGVAADGLNGSVDPSRSETDTLLNGQV